MKLGSPSDSSNPCNSHGVCNLTDGSCSCDFSSALVRLPLLSSYFDAYFGFWSMPSHTRNYVWFIAFLFKCKRNTMIFIKEFSQPNIVPNREHRIPPGGSSQPVPFFQPRNPSPIDEFSLFGRLVASKQAKMGQKWVFLRRKGPNPWGGGFQPACTFFSSQHLPLWTTRGLPGPARRKFAPNFF